jgi:TrmH family RNA methyltransferase
MITSPDNEKLKTIRKLASRRGRDRTGLFMAEGEDLVAAAEAAGVEPTFVLVTGEDVEAGLLDAVSGLGSGTRVIGVYRQRWSEPGGRLSAYLHGVGDPGNVGTIVRAGHAFCDGPVVLGPGCADPYSPKAVRASMGSIFARPPARASFEALPGRTLALDGRASTTVVEAVGELASGAHLTVCLGAEREGLPAELLEAADASARITVRPDGPESLNVAMAATVVLYLLGNRIAAHA